MYLFLRHHRPLPLRQAISLSPIYTWHHASRWEMQFTYSSVASVDDRTMSIVMDDRLNIVLPVVTRELSHINSQLYSMVPKDNQWIADIFLKEVFTIRVHYVASHRGLLTPVSATIYEFLCLNIGWNKCIIFLFLFYYYGVYIVVQTACCAHARRVDDGEWLMVAPGSRLKYSR